MTPSTPPRILLGITGGIAAYKSPDLVRRLRDRGAEVQVVMTGAAERFVTRQTFQAVSGRPVRTELWDEAAEAAMGHIELARWAGRVVIAPASADFIARLAAGLADDLLATICLATEAPILLAPAMNRVMWANAATRANIGTLTGRGMRLLGPDDGNQACGDTGAGRMVEPDRMAEAILAGIAGAGLLEGVRMLITAGPTREPIDPVRFISNRSSGKMGFALAAAAVESGAKVRLVAGPVGLPTPAAVERIDVESAEQMLDAVHRHIGQTDIFVAAAAVADYRPASAARDKIKKTAPEMALKLTRAPDILTQVAALANGPFTVGFAAETRDVEKNARAKLEQKQLDMIAANRVGAGSGFDSDQNALTVYWSGGEQELPKTGKRELARALVQIIARRYVTARETAGSR
ncbi:MAG: bifunctional phosphopantothenoylcysteine decarboxylase/phosphopantothenate--cysteine ligase CoaBC [Gammaproteobacteria bacterium]|nr:bifunctional phosphopantothenoylcysteine decarboxylase/phosphopantothenate--cysteine ligase CoaBC [Gammaproteobacteria bacterium]